MDDLSDVEDSALEGPQPELAAAGPSAGEATCLMDLLSEPGSPLLSDAPGSPSEAVPPAMIDLLSDAEPDAGAFEELSDAEAAAPAVPRLRRVGNAYPAQDSLLRRAMPGKRNAKRRNVLKKKMKRTAAAQSRVTRKARDQMQRMSEAMFA
jgi:hypothetical protein